MQQRAQFRLGFVLLWGGGNEGIVSKHCSMIPNVLGKWR